MRVTLRKVVTWVGVIVIVTVLLHTRASWLFPTYSNTSRKQFDFKIGSVSDYLAMVHGRTVRGSNLTISRSQSLWPNMDEYEDDRILKQLQFKNKTSNSESPTLKNILVYTGFSGWGLDRGRNTFLDQQCNINTCTLTDKKKDAITADVILFKNSVQKVGTKRPPHQLWILYLLESPYHTSGLGGFYDVINMTATYRHDSDIVAPYEKFVLHDENVKAQSYKWNYALGKTKQVAWFVSNCRAYNNRKAYARKLSQFISVDIYGRCGDHKCPRKSPKCSKQLNEDYKFYLAFENSNCRDYITEKFFVIGLQHNVIPIVMGAAPEDYKRAAPQHSYIHVDDFESPKQLADYLHILDEDDNLYNEYFRWKETGRFIDTLFWCRVCAMAHDTSHVTKFYRKLDEWWRGPEVCIGKDSWNKHPRNTKFIKEEGLLPPT